MQHHLPGVDIFAQADVAHQVAGSLALLRVVHPPADGLAAKEIQTQVQIVELTLDRGRQVGDVSAVNLIGRSGREGPRFAQGLAEALPAPVRKLARLPQQPVHRRFACNVLALVGQARHNLGRRQMAVFLAVQD